MTDERRVQQRFFQDLQAKISYRFLDSAPTEYIETVAANISCGGAFLQTKSMLPLASKVKVEFFLSIDDLLKMKFIVSVDTLRRISSQKQQVWVEATGVVIRQQEDGVAVIFDQNYELSPIQPVKG